MLAKHPADSTTSAANCPGAPILSDHAVEAKHLAPAISEQRVSARVSQDHWSTQSHNQNHD